MPGQSAIDAGAVSNGNHVTISKKNARRASDCREVRHGRIFDEKKVAQEAPANSFGPKWAGYILRVTGGNDNQGFPNYPNTSAGNGQSGGAQSVLPIRHFGLQQRVRRRVRRQHILIFPNHAHPHSGFPPPSPPTVVSAPQNPLPAFGELAATVLPILHLVLCCYVFES
ncbi:hypothetical protein B0H16DRAFT_1717809 [Mycena metata]|uniref:Uncharacterized protein n=1 Tax=Mycena metata TaxID=1033252 RepID=A0AAD7JHZ2_9AGAR|nr:hypothetical protein B0H16DRAFT_1717809 [Mycena metata]